LQPLKIATHSPCRFETTMDVILPWESYNPQSSCGLQKSHRWGSPQVFCYLNSEQWQVAGCRWGWIRSIVCASQLTGRPTRGTGLPIPSPVLPIRIVVQIQSTEAAYTRVHRRAGEGKVERLPMYTLVARLYRHSLLDQLCTLLLAFLSALTLVQSLMNAF